MTRKPRRNFRKDQNHAKAALRQMQEAAAHRELNKLSIKEINRIIKKIRQARKDRAGIDAKKK